MFNNQYDPFDRNQSFPPSQPPIPPRWEPPEIPEPPRRPLRDRMQPFMNARFFGNLLLLPMAALVLFLVSLIIDWLAGLGSEISFNVLRWFEGAGFRSQYELGNTFRLLLLAVFVGWAIRRFRR